MLPFDDKITISVPLLKKTWIQISLILILNKYIFVVMAILYLLPVYNQNEAIHIHIVTIRTSNHRNVREIKDCNYTNWHKYQNIHYITQLLYHTNK